MNYRTDINGLRAVAVLLVTLFHFRVMGFGSGFVGVDVFFVISGFLMFGIISPALAAGRFSVLGFWWARLLRIYPPMLVLIVALLGLGYLFLPPDAYRALAARALAALGAFVNVRFYAETFNYFAPARQASWLLHLWSLSVECQFYLLLPGFLMLCHRLRFLLIATMALAVAVWAVMELHDANAAFYLLPARVWEFLAGALACSYPGAIPPRHRPAVGWAGLALILATPLAHHYVPGLQHFLVLLPVAGAALVMAAPSANFALTHPLTQFFGTISYSLYLWHWPLWVAAQSWDLGTGPATIIGLFALATLLGAASYAVVERTSNRLRHRVAHAPSVLGFAAAGAAVAALCTVVMALNGLPNRAPAVIREATAKYPSEPTVRAPGCFVGPAAEPGAFAEECLHPPSPLTHGGVFIWGDSHAAHLWSGFAAAPDFKATRLFQMTGASCPPLLEPPVELSKHCYEINRRALEEITRVQPEVVVISARWFWYNGHGTDIIPQLRAVIARLREMHQRVVVIGPIPEWEPTLPELLLPATYRHGGVVPERLGAASHAGPRALDTQMAAAVREAGAIYASLFDQLCNDDGCKTVATVDGKQELIAWDYGHTTVTGATWIVAHAVIPAIDAAVGNRDWRTPTGR